MAPKTAKDYLFVGVQLLLFVAYAWRPNWLTFSRPAVLGNLGLLLAVVATLAGCAALLHLWKSFSPFPTPVAAGELITGGPFALARHPIYSSLLLAAFGYALYTGAGYRLLITAGLWLLFYYKSRYEEQRLAARYPGYAAYRQRVGRFSPWF